MSLKSDTKTPERRVFVRHNCEAEIEWAYFNTARYFNAKLLNFSRGGVYIETTHDITPGATIIIRLGKILSSMGESVNHEYPRLVSLGEVTWHTKILERHNASWKAGVRYPITA